MPGLDFAVILNGLVELGYRVCWRVLDAQFAGLAQRRDRVFIIGSLGDGRAASVLLEPESVRWNPPPRREAREGPAGTPGGGAAGRGRRDNPDSSGAFVAFTLNGSPRGTGPNSGNGWNSTLPVDVMPPLQAGSPTYERGDGSLGVVASPVTASAGHHGHSSPRGATIGVRRLTPRECERLQGFPDDWTAGHSDTKRYQMLGNAVAVPVAEWIGRRLP